MGQGADEETRPAALGRWEPPPESIVRRSGWRVDADAVSRAYAAALTLGATTVVAWVAWTLWRAPGLHALREQEADSAWAALRRAAEAYAAAPYVVLTVLFGFMGLGATKRCFGFDRGTSFGLLVAVLLQLGAWALSPGRERFLSLFAAGAGAGLAAAAGAAWWRWGRDTRRRALAATAYFQLWAFAWQAARARYLLRWWPDPPLSAQMAVAAGAAVGASLLAVPWLWRAGAAGSSSRGGLRSPS